MKKNNNNKIEIFLYSLTIKINKLTTTTKNEFVITYVFVTMDRQK